jgi:hypothetical protein
MGHFREFGVFRGFQGRTGMASTKALWIRSAGTLLVLFLFGNVASMSWRWGRPYLLGDPLAGFPRVFLWAWERPENLKYLDPRIAGVAVLAKTLTLEDSRVTAKPRMQPIRLPAGICAIAVIRIETRSAIICSSHIATCQAIPCRRWSRRPFFAPRERW